jgi:excisionase family DNA binding protein
MRHRTIDQTSERIAYSIPELARRLGVSAAFLRLEGARHKLMVTRLGRRALVRAEEVERYLRAGDSAYARGR